MRSDVRHWIGFAVAIGIVAVGATAIADPLVTGFTHQGQLKDAGIPADGEYDFKFRLYDSTNTQVGGEVEFEFVQVTDGLFTRELDCGPGIFTGEALWLEIDVRASGSGSSFTTLLPRQPLTAAPYALYALSARGAAAASGTRTATTSTTTTAATSASEPQRLRVRYTCRTARRGGRRRGEARLRRSNAMGTAT
ncbi:MAG: hypothetical protein ACYSVY_03675 [Planctomycetota bacterium]